ncbi:uncharacterized protein PHALS_10129 [Plasmopara halstedii]|uniref:Uncharacterized protein n=1 Tax=Plasmopara halstedii TaxID=4781 RepID=A0A0P1AFL8_PLAHL|nr:uncharacterized protein PHALS_10129 [Plasmopara halstedii]CEG39901.1 hypothetical protein PHALS_10129 [Plasmopara halstedii]|eukprot:XP_024576270.1 hypothetical protein PHALS_10129 [Plasmopara halstedii]
MLPKLELIILSATFAVHVKAAKKTPSASVFTKLVAENSFSLRRAQFYRY